MLVSNAYIWAFLCAYICAFVRKNASIRGMIASIRGKKPHVYRVIILKQMADHIYRLNLVPLFCFLRGTCHSLKHVSVLPVSLRRVISRYCCCRCCLSPTGYIDNKRSHKVRSP